MHGTGVLMGGTLTRWIRRVVIVAFAVGALVGLSTSARADALCARLGTWQPVGSHSVCVPMP